MNRIKGKLGIALAGIILAGSIGWSELPARAATNGTVICSHRTSQIVRTFEGYEGNYQGHMKKYHMVETCTDICHKEIGNYYQYGNYEAHEYTEWEMIEDRGDGLYRFRIWCSVCGYEDETLSDDPNDPKE